MKAMLLAAGRGKRMGALTSDCPKPLLKVAGKPLIEHHVERLVASGFHDIVINLCYLGQQIEDFLGEGSRWGAAIEYSYEQECLETGGGIYNALPLLGEQPFLVMNGDVWTDFPIASLTDCLQSPSTQQIPLAYLVLVPNPDHNLFGDFCLTQDDSCSPVKTEAKARVSAQADVGIRYTFSGISVLHPELFGSEVSGAFPLAPLLRQAILKDRVEGGLFCGQWVDVGTPERLLAVNKTIKEQRND